MCVFPHISQSQRTQIKRDVEIFVEFSFCFAPAQKNKTYRMSYENTLKHWLQCTMFDDNTHFHNGTNIMCVDFHIKKNRRI